MNRPKIKVGFCVAYDWVLLKNSIPRVYDNADEICLSIDKYRTSWSGKKYEFDENAFRSFINQIDTGHKIRVYEDVFSSTEKSPLENDNYQRNKMAEFMGEGGWHIQIDADEYFLDFKGFVDFLIKLNDNPKPTDKAVNVSVNLIPLIKKTKEGYIFVDFDKQNFETAPFATNNPIYKAARRNDHFNIISNSFAIHETWSRDEKELWNKINNWGHRDDFDKDSYYRMWLALDKFNYKHIKNFHPIENAVWPALMFCEGRNIDEFITNLQKIKSYKTDEVNLYFTNNRNWQRVKSLFRKIMK
jgi:hypothetical protein